MFRLCTHVSHDEMMNLLIFKVRNQKCGNKKWATVYKRVLSLFQFETIAAGAIVGIGGNQPNDTSPKMDNANIIPIPDLDQADAPSGDVDTIKRKTHHNDCISFWSEICQLCQSIGVSDWCRPNASIGFMCKLKMAYSERTLRQEWPSKFPNPSLNGLWFSLILVQFE